MGFVLGLILGAALLTGILVASTRLIGSRVDFEDLLKIAAICTVVGILPGVGRIGSAIVLYIMMLNLTGKGHGAALLITLVGQGAMFFLFRFLAGLGA